VSARPGDEAARFELLHFAVVPVSGTLAVLSVEARLPDSERFPRRPRLVIGWGPEQTEVEPLSSALVGDRWHGTFAAPVDAALDRATRFVLTLPDLLLELPAPDREPDADRFVRLAREVNKLRHALERARDENRAAREAVAAAARATEEAAAEARRRAEADARERVAALHAELESARAEIAAAEERADARVRAERERRRELERRLAALESAIERERELHRGEVAELRDQIAAQRAEQRELRVQLRVARAQLEAARAGGPVARPTAEPRPRADASATTETRMARPAAGDPSEEVTRVAGRRPAATVEGERPATATPAASAGEEGAAVTRRAPTAPPVPEEQLLSDPYAGDPIESVRVIGRPARKVDPVPAIPPEHAAPPEGPGLARWLWLAAFFIFIAVLAYVLLVA
jgi:hypothetical protein